MTKMDKTSKRITRTSVSDDKVTEVVEIAREAGREAVDAVSRTLLGRIRGVAGRVLGAVLTGLRAALHWLQTPRGMMLAGVGASLAALLWMMLGGDMPDSNMICAAAIVPGIAGGRHVGGEPLTTGLTEQVSPGLLRNEIDNRIVRIRPMATPIDQISRMAGSRLCGSMIVDYYSVDTKQVWTDVTEDADSDDTDALSGLPVAVIKVKEPAIFDISETILVPEVSVSDGESDTQSLVLYVTGVDTKAGTITVLSVNYEDHRGVKAMPTLEAGTRLVRMGRAAAELDVQTGQFEAIPRREQNFCQIFKAQVEQSTYMKIANKEVGWSFSDQEEAAIIDMRQGMEKNFIFGLRSRFVRPGSSDDVLLTGGIWHQIGKQYTYGSGGSRLTATDVVQIMRTAFTGQGASSRKLLIAGSGFIEALNGLQVDRVISAGESVTKWGLTFTELHSNFGVLYVLHSEMFDECGHEDDAMVIDPEYLTKYCHVPFRTEKLNLRASGIRNTDAIVITEASCLVLRYPKAHVRITRTR